MAVRRVMLVWDRNTDCNFLKNKVLSKTFGHHRIDVIGTLGYHVTRNLF